MSRVSKRAIGAIVALLVLSNLWLLTHKHLPTRLDLSALRGRGRGHGGATGADAAAAGDSAADEGDSEDLAPSHTAGNHSAGYKEGMRLVKQTLAELAAVKPNDVELGEYLLKVSDHRPDQSENELPATTRVLSLYLQVSEEDTEELRRTHKEVIEKLPEPSADFSQHWKGRGIVMTGGGKYFPMVLTAIRWIRETDTETPIEVFMHNEAEYEEHICEGLFPQLNAECRVVRDVYGAKLSEKLLSKYALKPMAILASKFDDIYFMDADSYPLVNVNHIFDWDVYAERGLVLTADYWARFTSPKFYDIAGVQLGDRARGPEDGQVLYQSDREGAVPGMSTESGQIYVRKSAHMRTLLLAMYYNIYGPDCYFPLLMMGGPGEGDKDTYATAATILNASYYQTQRTPLTLGQHLGDHFKGYSMSPIDPIIEKQRNEGLDVTEEFIALHANIIKSNAKYMLINKDDVHGFPPLRQWRFFGKLSGVAKAFHKDEDLELKLFRSMQGMACEWAVEQGYVPRDWQNDADPERICRILRHHTEWLSENPEVAAPLDAKYWIDLDNN